RRLARTLPGRTVAETELAAAAAGARRIGPAFPVVGLDRSHDFHRRPALRVQAAHLRHRRARVAEERVEPFAQVVVARLAVPGQHETVFRAAAVAERTHFALLALARQRVALVAAKLALR